MVIKKESKSRTDIPNSSMSDIIFMLLIFFMVSTTIKTVDGLKVDLPRAASIAKLDVRKQSVLYVFIDNTGLVNIQDKVIQTEEITGIVYPMRRKDNELTISLRADKEAKMGVVSDVQNQLRNASALKVNYSARPK